MTFESRTFARFWLFYDELPRRIQQQADKQYVLFAENPFHPSLHLKPVGRFWSVHISGSYRALAVREGDVKHDRYEELARS